MKAMIGMLTVAALFCASVPAFAWGAFSRWTTADRPESDSICHAIRSTGSTRTGLAYTFNLQVQDGFHTYGVAENVTGRTKGADLWLQAWHGRAMKIVAETQGFNIVPGNFISIHLFDGLPTYAFRCAVQ